MSRIFAILTVVVLSAPLPSLAAPGKGDTLSISVTNQYGDLFTNLTVAQIAADGLVLEHKAGQLKVKYEQLPQAVREKYQALAADIAKKEREHAQANTAYAAHKEQLQAEAATTREQSDWQKANTPVEKNIEVPEQGWKIVVPDVGLKEGLSQTSENLFVYTAAGEDGFELTLFVQKPDGIGDKDEDVFEHYWSRAGQNPAIDQDSVKAERANNFIKVSFTIDKVPHANYYFAYRGRWAAVHITKKPYRETDARLFSEFDRHLSYY